MGSKRRGKNKIEITCEICNAKYDSRAGLKYHIAVVHEGKRKFKCSICDAAFNVKDGLTRHSQVHEVKKPNRCGICDSNFATKVTLKGHIARVHEGKKP